MRPGSAPSLVNPVMLFQQATCTNLQLSSGTHKHSIKGSLSKDGKVCWMYSGSILEVVATETQNRLAAWNFGLMLHDSEVVIQCVAEFWAGDSLRLLVGLKNSSIAGLVCVLNVNLSRVVKAIEIPFKVTSIECITSLLGNDFPVWAFSEHLSCFYGIVAVGTEGGHVYLIDMCLDTHDQSDEMFPNTLHFISPDTEDVVQTRHEALSQRQVLCMELGMDFFSLGSFNYHSNDESIVKQFKTDEICVTCLKYMSRNGLLAVGYNFGCFQLWRLSAPVLEYSSRLDDSGSVPITHIAYQEPENDPKNFSYLWVARGPLAYSSEEGYLANITLYQLSFNKRMWYSSKECFYEEMSTIGIRLEHDLSCEPSNSPSSKMSSSNVISCYTLEDPYFFPPVRSIDDSHEEASCNPDLSLCVFVWRADNGSKSGTTSYHLAIFDMNRWYHAQMPSDIRTLGSSGICPYMAFCSLDEVIDNTLPDELLCAHVNPSTVRKFISDPGLIQEQLFYPSSLQFDVFCLMESGLVNARYLGMQRQVLSTIQKLGPSSLIDPNEIYKMCVFVGLAHRSHDAATPAFSLTNSNREAILSLCLEHHLVNVITKSVEQWADGEYLPQGCTLKFLLDWTWNKVVQIKQCVDNTCKPFYDWSGLPVDERCVQILHHSLQKLIYLTHVLQKFIHTSAPITENGIEELCQKFDAVQLLSHHLKAVIWFVESGLLPENDELASYIPGLYRYPRTSLIEVFMKRREELQQLHSDVKASELLMIDGLIENTAPAVRDLWQQDGGDGQYPPPSINALINFYLLDNVPLLLKHCVISYFLLDLASLEDDSNVKLSEKVNTFADVFSVPSDTMNLITGFWLLDHKDFEVAFSFLVNSPVFGPWQHKQVIKALLYQNEGKLALRYLAVKQPPLSSPEEVKLKLTTFLVNGMTAQAVEFQRTCCDQNNAQDLISHIFLGCQQTKTMDQLLKLPLTELEEKWLENYLLTSMESQSEELLVMYYLQRARFVDAIRLNERLKTKAFGVLSAKDRERASTRNTIVNGCAKLLPEVQRQLIFEPAVLPRKINRVPRPKPLSTMVTKSHPSKLISQSTFVLAVMEKMQEVAQVEADTSNGSFEDFRQRPVEPFISTPITPKKRTPLSDLSKVVYERNLVDEQKSGLRLSPSTTPPMAANLFAYGEAQNKRYVSAEAVSVLQTPIIHRKNTPRSHVTSPRPTPQSILKVRQISNKSPNMHSSSPLSIRDKDVPQPRSALRSSKLNLGLNDPTGTPLGASAKKTKLLRFAEPVPDSPVSPQDSPTPSCSNAFPILTTRTNLSERKTLSELIAAESCPVSETVADDNSLEDDAEMMEAEEDGREEEEEEEAEEEEVVVGTEDDNVEEIASHMVTDTKDEDITDEDANSVETDENKEDEEDDEAMEGVEEDLAPVTYVEPPVQEPLGPMHFQAPLVSAEDLEFVKNTMMMTEEEPEFLICRDPTVGNPDYLEPPSTPIDLTEDDDEDEVEAEEFKPFESADILELAPLGQKSSLSQQVEDFTSTRNVERLHYEEQEMDSDDQYMADDVPGEDKDVIVAAQMVERDYVQIMTESVSQHIPQDFIEATNQEVDIVELEDDEEEEEEVIEVIEEDEEVVEELEEKESEEEEAEEKKEIEVEVEEEELEELENDVEVEEVNEIEEEQKETEEEEIEEEQKETEEPIDTPVVEEEEHIDTPVVEEEEEEHIDTPVVEEEEEHVDTPVVEEEEEHVDTPVVEEEEPIESEVVEEEKESPVVVEEPKESEIVEEEPKESEMVEEEPVETPIVEEEQKETGEVEEEAIESEVEEPAESPLVEVEPIETPVVDEEPIESEVEELAESPAVEPAESPIVEEVEHIETPVVEEETKESEMAVEEAKESEMAVEEAKESEMAMEEPKESEMAMEEPKESEVVLEEQKDSEMVEEAHVEPEIMEEPKESAVEEPIELEMVEEPKGSEVVEVEEEKESEMVEKPKESESVEVRTEIEIVEEEEEEEKIKLLEMEEIPEMKGGKITISKSLTSKSVRISPSHSASTRNSSRSASPQSTSSISPIPTRRSLRSKKLKVESKEANRSEPAPVPAMTKSISVAADIASESLMESTSDKVVSQSLSTRSFRQDPSKSSERRSTRKKTSQKSLKAKLESVKKDLEEASNVKSDFSEKSWLEEEDQTISQLVRSTRRMTRVSVKLEAIPSEIPKQELVKESVKEDKEADRSLNRTLRSSRSVTQTRKSSRLKTDTPSREPSPTQSSPPRVVGRTRGTTPPRETDRTRGTTPPRETGRTRGTTPPRETTPLRVLPVRASTPTRGDQSTKVSNERSSTPPLVNIKIENKDESRVKMEETEPEPESQVRTNRRTTRKTALKSRSQASENTESDENDINSPVLLIKQEVIDMCETPPNQQKPFVFAPPITRKKGQRKESTKKEVKAEDSSMIIFSTRSQRTTIKKEPFTEPEPEEMAVDIPMEEPHLESPTTSPKKKTVKGRSTRKKVYLVKTTDSPIVNLLTPSRHKTEPEEKEPTRTAQSRILRKPAHSMVLRTKAAVKKRKL